MTHRVFGAVDGASLPTEPIELLARDVIASGLRVFRCKMDKSPAVNGWQKSATIDFSKVLRILQAAAAGRGMAGLLVPKDRCGSS